MQVLYTTMMTTTKDGMQEKECTYVVRSNKNVEDFFSPRRGLFFPFFVSLVHKQYLVVCTMGGGLVIHNSKIL